MRLPHRIKLDIDQEYYNLIPAQQGDTARVLNFQILNNNIPFSLENKTVRARIKKPDGNVCYNDMEIINASAGECDLKLTNQILIKPGMCKVQLEIMENGEILSTIIFAIFIRESIDVKDAAESTNEFTALENGIIKLDEWDKYFKETSGAIEEKYTERLNGIDSSLEETKTEVTNLEESKATKDEVKKINLNVSKGIIRGVLYKIPFNFPIKFNIKRNVTGVIETDFEPESLFPSGIIGKTYYVDNVNGLDSNDGLTMNTPFKTIKHAIAQSDVLEIIAKGGLYRAAEAFELNKILTKSIKLKSYDDSYILLVHDHCGAYSWNIESENCYKTSRSQAVRILDMTRSDDEGDYFKYTRKANVSGVISNPGTFYTDDATSTLYINTIDGRIPDKNLIFGYEAWDLLNFQTGYLYLENVKLFGGARPMVVGGNSTEWATLLAKNCEFAYGINPNLGNGLNTLGGDAFLKRCKAYKNRRDGFNYHQDDAKTRSGYFIEDNCIGRHNGLGDSNNSNNGTTAHDNCIGIRINGLYFECQGPTVADVNNSKSYNVGVCAYDNKNPSVEKFGFYTRDTTKMYLENCYSYGNEYDCYAYGEYIQAKDCIFENTSHKLQEVDEFS